jgi:hypothetical protein
MPPNLIFGLIPGLNPAEYARKRLRSWVIRKNLGGTAKGGVSTSTACSVAVVKAHQPKLWSLGLNLEFYHLRLIYARVFDVLAKTLYISVTSRAIAYMLCVFGQCGVLGYPYGTTASTPTKVACDMRDHSDFREDKA